MPHCDATSDAAAASSDRGAGLRQVFDGFAFGLFSVLAGLLVVCACVAQTFR